MNKRKNNVKREEFESRENNTIVKSNKIQNFHCNKDLPNFFEVAFNEIVVSTLKMLREMD